MNVTQIQDAITKVIEGRKQKSEAVDGLDAENSQLIDEINCLNNGVDELLDAISQEEFRADKRTANVQTQVFEHCKSFKQALCALLAKCGCDNGGGQALLGSKEEDDGRREIIVKRVIEELKGRFSRTKIDIGAAAGTQSGKSLTLCNMVGLEDQGVRSFFPIGGNRESTTGASGCVCNVDPLQKQEAVIEYFDWRTFRDKILTPLIGFLRGQKISEYLRAKFQISVSSVPSSIEQFRRYELPQEPNFGDNAPEGCKPVWHRLSTWLACRKDYIENLSVGPVKHDHVSLSESYKYSAYPTAIERDEAARRDGVGSVKLICPSVKLVTGYVTYPNQVAKDFVFWDLPGKGELGAPDVTYRYEESFTLQKDVIFYVRMYRAGQTLSEATLRDLKEIVKKLPEHVKLKDYVPIFINVREDDNNVDNKLREVRKILHFRYANEDDAVVGVQEGSEFNFYRVKNCKDPDKDPLNPEFIAKDKVNFLHVGPVFFVGSAKDVEFVQNQFLPALCLFVAQRTPRIDDACIQSVKDSVDEVKQQLKELVDKLKSEIGNDISQLPGAVLMEDYSTWAEKLGQLMFNRGLEVFDLKKDISGAHQEVFVETIIREIRAYLDDKDSGLFVRQNMTQLHEDIASGLPARPLKLVEELLYLLRRGLLERFSRLQENYEGLVVSKINEYFSAIRDVPDGVPFLRWDPEKPRDALRAWIELLDNAGCETLKSAALQLYELHLNFYVTIYPDLREMLYRFDVSEIIETEFSSYLNPTEEFSSDERVNGIIESLQGMAKEWLNEMKSALQEKTRNDAIMLCSFERFVDETRNLPPRVEGNVCRSGADEDRRKFCCHYWSEYKEAKKIGCASDTPGRFHAFADDFLKTIGER